MHVTIQGDAWLLGVQFVVLSNLGKRGQMLLFWTLC